MTTAAARPLDPASPDTARENQFLAHVDAEGYVVGGSVVREKLPGFDFLATMRELRDRYPLDPADIVMPAGWPVDADGRLLSVIEVQRGHHLTTQTQEKAV